MGLQICLQYHAKGIANIPPISCKWDCKYTFSIMQMGLQILVYRAVLSARTCWPRNHPLCHNVALMPISPPPPAPPCPRHNRFCRSGHPGGTQRRRRRPYCHPCLYHAAVDWSDKARIASPPRGPTGRGGNSWRSWRRAQLCCHGVGARCRQQVA